MYEYVYVSNCSSAVFEAIVECFFRQLKEEMWAECTDGGRGGIGLWANPESIQCAVEDQAFSPPPTPSASCISLLLLPVCRRRSSLLTGEGVGEEHMTARMPGPL